MAKGTYNYDLAKIAEPGKDRMRFELGDTMVEGETDTVALTDEEIEAAITIYPNWKRAKLFLLESIYRRFSYEVDAKTGPLTLEMQERAKQWKKDYDDLKREIANETISAPPSFPGSQQKEPYFYTGMHGNERTK